MESPLELLAALPALVTALALLLAWLLLRRGAAPAPVLAPESTSPAETPGAPAPPEPPEPCAPEPAPAGPCQSERVAEPGESEAEEPAAEGRQDEDSDSEMGPPTEDPEEEEDGDAFSFKYSPGQLRGSQYKTMMTKEELEEEQRTEE